MAVPESVILEANKHVVASVKEQIRELQPGLQNQVEIANISAELTRLQKQLQPLITGALDSVLAQVIQDVAAIQSGQKSLSDFGLVLADLYLLQQSLEDELQALLDTVEITKAEKENLESVLLNVIVRTKQILGTRPDVNAVMDDLAAMKNLRGGPADATALHDFHVLQIAFESVWMHAFDENLKDTVKTLFAETVRLYDEHGLIVPNFDAINDINDLYYFIGEVKKLLDPKYTGVALPVVIQEYAPEAAPVWNLLSSGQQKQILTLIAETRIAGLPVQIEARVIREAVAEIIKQPLGTAARLTRLLYELQEALSEPYAFDIFAPNSYNFGLMMTYRQKWEPGTYQAGDLVATIPLAPGESRKFSKKRVVKTSRAQKEIEKSMSSRSQQFSEISRAEAEIMQKVSTATNFKATAHGSFNIGIGNIDATTEFMLNQEQQSALNKKTFHEATIKAAEEYRLERTLEIDTTSTFETEETSSGEISNPNNEITVTYLFYELQRRFKIHEFLYRVRPVILVAQDVPAPHEIDEAWLIQYQWILSRVLLDDSLRPALNYLTSGFAGDEVSINIIKAHWEAQVAVVRDLEGQVKTQLTMRDVFRGQLEGKEIDEALAKAEQTTAAADIASDVLTGGGALAVLTGGLSTLFTAKEDAANMEEAVKKATMAEAARKAGETRLKYVEEALADAQDKLRQATTAFEKATKEYAAAMQNQFSRHVAIDQLRIHVKQNILYYMQAIWDHEPPDQRFFRLYNKMVACPKPDPNCSPSIEAVIDEVIDSDADLREVWHISRKTETRATICNPISFDYTELVEIADLDNPLGYKGNYIIFPMKGECYLTQYMLSEFIDDYLGVLDPDGSDSFDAETFDQEWRRAAAITDSRERGRRQAELRNDLINYITAIRRSTDEIIVPTGQLFIEALPGSHPLLEDFKLLHRLEDVRKVKSEVRRAELENLRLASRVIGGQDKAELLEDPDVEKKVVLDGNGSVPVVVNP
jgi:hypothetical protein